MYRPGLRYRAAAASVAVAATAALAVGLATAGSASAASPPVWLCKPGLAHDPCTPGLSTTVYSATLQGLGVQHPKPAKRPAIDCFYVYPTVSDQPTGNANLHVDPAERSIALYQAARYSQYCKVYAPIYRQVTIAGIGQTTPPTTKPSSALALRSVRSAFNYYLAHDNHGRGFILIGHSQGAILLRQLIAKEIDPRPAVRNRLVSAILMGSNVLVKKGRKGVGGDFKHIPACRAESQLGCVIAFSNFDQPVPAGSLFGRSGNSAFGAKANKHDIVLCTNPAALSGGSAVVDPIFPSAPVAPGGLAYVFDLVHLTDPMPATTWYTLRDAYRAQCVTSNGAHVLMVTPLNGAQVPNPSPTPMWGLHLVDANIELGNLVAVEKAQAAAYIKRYGQASE